MEDFDNVFGQMFLTDDAKLKQIYESVQEFYKTLAPDEQPSKFHLSLGPGATPENTIASLKNIRKDDLELRKFDPKLRDLAMTHYHIDEILERWDRLESHVNTHGLSEGNDYIVAYGVFENIAKLLKHQKLPDNNPRKSNTITSKKEVKVFWELLNNVEFEKSRWEMETQELEFCNFFFFDLWFDSAPFYELEFCRKYENCF